jgi:L-ascorbate metabolism protein UlaG (beta-lactamase superfamily)
MRLPRPLGPSSAPLRITRIAHACVLFEYGDEALLTDPWFSERALYHPGERFALSPAELPRLSGVVTSMVHYDHFDVGAFAAYRDLDVPMTVVAGSKQKALAERAGFRDVRPLMPWQTIELGPFRIHAVPADPTKPPADYFYEQASVIEVGGMVVLFSAHRPTDAALAEIAARFPRIDLALLGINGLRIKPMLMRKLVMDPPDAAALCARLGVAVVVPIHYAFNGGWVSTTFLVRHKGTPEQFSEALRRLAPATAAVTLSPGQPFELTGSAASS